MMIIDIRKLNVQKKYFGELVFECEPDEKLIEIPFVSFASLIKVQAKYELFEDDSLDFSFSGIKTAVINVNHNTKDINHSDLCASFQKTVTETLIKAAEGIAVGAGIGAIVTALGVSAPVWAVVTLFKIIVPP